ncbi:MAG: glyoxalase [Spirochaetaceae bacterium]|nr:glyoxalase [Spirochaetaceae bacterium]|tara:strand:+ start:90059 stop:90424 length:366 start_codon:yes stop_codon:yes gene_type:complete
MIHGVWFEIPVLDLENAKSFYEKILQQKLEIHELGPLRMAWFPMKEGAYGCAGTLVQAQTYEPSYSGTMIYLGVDDIDAVLKRVSEAGGKVLNEKSQIGEHGYVGHFEDCEGNRVGLHSDK